MEIKNEKHTDKYVVMRDNIKISNDEFTLEEATNELNRWKAILKKWPDGTKVRIEPLSN
jgi:hypothetical protein